LSPMACRLRESQGGGGQGPSPVARPGTPPLIYNLFPTLAGPAPGWVAHAARAAQIGFDWLYVNPIHYPGFSGSLYAVKDHFRLHPVVAPPNGADAPGLAALAPTVRAIRALGI